MVACQAGTSATADLTSDDCVDSDFHFGVRTHTCTVPSGGQHFFTSLRRYKFPFYQVPITAIRMEEAWNEKFA